MTTDAFAILAVAHWQKYVVLMHRGLHLRQSHWKTGWGNFTSVGEYPNACGVQVFTLYMVFISFYDILHSKMNAVY